QNRVLAAWLACIAGFVNSAGFLLVGSFTSHVTGSAGRLAHDVAQRDFAAAGGARAPVGAVVRGARPPHPAPPARVLPRRARIYALLLFVEAALLALFAYTARDPANARAADVEAALLCFAMGLQNSMVTLISDARVRTTHLTGVVTDLGIEAARWVR